MNETVTNNSYICRLCLKFNRKSLNLYNTRNVESLRIKKFVQQLCSIKLKQDEPFPKCICYPCKMKVISTQEFINTCKESDKTLRRIYYTSNDKEMKLEQQISQAEEQEDEEPEKSKMEIEIDDDLLARSRSLRSSRKIALIASIPLLNSNSHISNDIKPQKFDNVDMESTGQKVQAVNENEKVHLKIDTNLENKTEKIKIFEENNGTERSIVKSEINSICEEEASKCSELKINDDDNNSQADMQVQIKEEFIIPDNENEDLQESFSDYLMDSNNSNLIETENSLEIKTEPLVQQECTSKEESMKTDDQAEKDNMYTVVINEREEELFRRKLQFEKISNPKIMYRKSNTDLEPRLFHKITSCPICNRVYDRKGNLYNHLKLQHNLLSMKEVHKVLSSRKEIIVRESLTCNICNKIFDSKTTFNEHQSGHPGHAMQVQCENCSATFTSLYSKRRHQQLSCNKPYECVFCSTKFRTFKDFRVHMNTHKN